MRGAVTMAAGWLVAVTGAGAVQIRGYDAARHDRFTGFPAAPVENAGFLHVAARFRAYGWDVLSVADGNTDLDGIAAAVEAAFSRRERPVLVIVRTSIGYGSPNKQDTADAHGSPLGEAEIALAKERLGWPASPGFLIPEDVLAHFREAVGRGARLEEEWNRRFAAYAAAFPELAAEWNRQLEKFNNLGGVIGEESAFGRF